MGIKTGFLRAAVMAAATAAASMFAMTAGATTVTVSATIQGNDCSGYFGSGFGACQIFAISEGVQVLISPVIVKFGFEDTGLTTEVNSIFPSVTGAEFTYQNASTGTWNYTPGSNDPGVRYWAAKGSSSFNLFWTVNASDTASGGVCAPASLSLACLNAALAVTTGSYFTPNNGSGRPAGLSHLTFYDSVAPSIVPLPAAGWMLLAGIGGLAALRRRRKAA